MKEMFYTKIKKRNLLLLASVVWLLAGFNILRIGIITYKDNLTIINLFISIVIFILFWFMVFGKLVRKHTYRIINYKEEKQLFLKFFDIKSFFIMAFMISFGIGIRISNIFPDLYIAVFYSGLGAALFLAGLLFGYNFFTQTTEK
ncbi:conserved hypothetical protein [Lachnoclostridium phytofermentans ISDg]|uniref:Uncharacterized protein n=2 Tax=Lachnoclostridium phytofermentans TaxID=66219 RepID=A9KT13_LACP7|nr:conserved hypothetical protein [Lachnoclostridium phytofermentans ISDg]